MTTDQDFIKEHIIVCKPKTIIYRLYAKGTGRLIKESDLFEDITDYIESEWSKYCSDSGTDPGSLEHFIAFAMLGYDIREE